MLKFRSIIISGIVVLHAFAINAQRQWTLEECINYAYDNNLQIQRENLKVRSAENNVLNAWFQTLPTANAFGNYTFNKGRAPNFDTYEYVDQAFEDGNVGVESRLNLFSGLSNYFAIRQNS